METKVGEFRTWDDLVFSNRNQAYGAYPLRRAYTDRMMLALGISTAVAAILLMAPLVLPDHSKAAHGKVNDRIICILNPPVLVPVVPRSRATVPASSTNTSNRTVRVVREEVIAPVEDEPVAPSVISETGTPGGEGLISEGTDVQLAEIPAVTQNEIPSIVEVMPQYEGGLEGMMKFIKKKIHYPVTARRQGKEGTVYVSFVVNGDGSISHVSVIRGFFIECDEEAMRVISMMPGWKGGKQNGNPVAVRMVLPITFNMQH